VAFPDCPTYGEWAANSSTAFAKAFYVLNCRPVGAIGPGQSVRFAMEIPVPSGTAAGQYMLYWTFLDTLDLTKPIGKVVLSVTR